MSVTDRKISKDAYSARKTIDAPLITALSQVRTPFFMHKVGHSFVVTAAELFCSLYAAVLNLDVLIASANCLVSKGTLAISATPEKFKTTTPLWWITGGLLKTKAITDLLVFSAANTINNGTAAGFFYGAWLVQVDAAGTVTTKPAGGLADQVYATEAAAIAALPAADAAKVAIGYITVEAKTGAKWTATTDDLTAGSDCQTRAFYDATQPTSIFDSAMPVMATGYQAPTLATVAAQLRGQATDALVGVYTSDGGGALTNGRVAVTVRPNDMNGDGGLGS